MIHRLSTNHTFGFAPVHLLMDEEGNIEKKGYLLQAMAKMYFRALKLNLRGSMGKITPYEKTH